MQLEKVLLGLAIAAMAGCAPGVVAPTGQEALPGELIVRFRDGTPVAARQALRMRFGADAEAGALPDTEKWRLPEGRDPGAVMAVVSGEPEIKYATRNYVRRVLGFRAAELKTIYPSGLWALEQIKAPEAWDTYFSADNPPGKGVLVAVVDSGVDVRHPDLSANIARDGQGNPLYVDVLRDASSSYDVCRGYYYDWVTAYRDVTHLGPDGHGHGTHVAGIIAAQAGNPAYGYENIVGVAPAAQILPVKTMDCRGDGQDWNIAYGIKAAADMGARVLNLSIGGPEPSSLLEDALGYAIAKGTLIVVAAGNGSGSPVFYPAAYPGVIAVGAVNRDDVYQSFSNIGPEMALVAPGGTINQTVEGILSTVPTYITEMDKTGKHGFARVSGTSQASPFVAGAAALIWSREPSLTADQVRERLYASAADLGTRGFDTKHGWGRLDVAAALALGDHRYAAP
ncbi:MAG: S8 family serine peptidase [Candidatus Sericytochromatia bacterium]|nr:S8 family serine peptidase [Candidatus Tanganyikabacteria bacterium]